MVASLDVGESSMNLVVSACLMGEACRYDGGSKPCAEVQALSRRVRACGGNVCPVCPERAGGLPVPRPPAEIMGERVLARDGRDVTAAFERGAQRSVREACAHGVPPLAVLKAKSPSCGVGLVYDGTYSGQLTVGDGVFSRLLQKKGVVVATEDDVRVCRPSVEHPVAVVLGSGLGHLAGLVKPVRRISYYDMPGFPASARPVAGHSFEATVGTINGVPVVVYPGRPHLYQGFTAVEVTSLVRHARRLGCRVVVFACATGAIPDMARPGLGIICDHINLTGHNPLRGYSGQERELASVDDDFFDMVDVYTPYLRGVARGVAGDLGIELGEGVLAGVLGPSFETPAEAAALGRLGVSYVGMSTVCEAIMAHALGMRVLGLTLAANYAGKPGISHHSVLMAARYHSEDFERLMCGILKLL